MTSLQFQGALTGQVAVVVSAVLAAIAYWLYRRETIRSGCRWGRTIPLLRSMAIFLVLMMLSGPTLLRRYQEGEPGKVTIVIDDSESMTLHDGEEQTRFERAVDRLSDRDDDILGKLAENHEVHLVRAHRDQVTNLWASTVSNATPPPENADDWIPESFSRSTGIGRLISKNLASSMVVISDGQINDGPTLAEVAQRLPLQSQPIYTVGMGKSKSISDVTILGIEYPDRLYRKDKMTGKIVLKEMLPEGESYRVEILDDAGGDSGTVLWQETLISLGKGQRSIGFTFAIESTVQKQIESGTYDNQAIDVNRNAIPIALRCNILLDSTIAELQMANSASKSASTGLSDNHVRRMPFWSSLHRAKVLLVDGRSRWETRYLKNLYQRDPYWELSTVIAEHYADGSLDETSRIDNTDDEPDQSDRLPGTFEELADFDLLLLGELPSGFLTPEFQGWIEQYVQEVGGGLIVIDGSRDAWSDDTYRELARLLPVIRSGSNIAVSPTTGQFIPSQSGRSLAAFQIANTADENAAAWRGLPKLQTTRRVRAAPGAEVLASLDGNSLGEPNAGSSTPVENGATQDGEIPLLVTKMSGAGRVLYSATEETWRWRYKVADAIHQRFWNQVSRYAMRTPYVIENAYVGLDAGAMNYVAGQEVMIRCKLKDSYGRPLQADTVEAILKQRASPSQKEIAISLNADSKLPGVYSGVVSNLAEGDYEVRIASPGLPREALEISTQFQVQATESVELRETGSDVESLKKLAEASGGQYLPENQLGSLVEILRPLSKGKIVQSELAIWQSYWWFMPVIGLLSAEWLLRKRTGLL